MKQDVTDLDRKDERTITGYANTRESMRGGAWLVEKKGKKQYKDEGGSGRVIRRAAESGQHLFFARWSCQSIFTRFLIQCDSLLLVCFHPRDHITMQYFNFSIQSAMFLGEEFIFFHLLLTLILLLMLFLPDKKMLFVFWAACYFV